MKNWLKRLFWIKEKEINVYYINTIDPISFRDFVKKNPDAIIEALIRGMRDGSLPKHP